MVAPLANPRYRLLIVAADANRAYALSKLLKHDGGYLVQTASTLEAATNVCRNEQFDLALIDFAMLREEGTEFPKTLSEHSSVSGETARS
jgi:CheY-like chemotaxis protein